jgi:pimeloyl-ACP methyl ester carboxylesterase
VAGSKGRIAKLKRPLNKGERGSTIATPTPLSASTRAVLKYLKPGISTPHAGHIAVLVVWGRNDPFFLPPGAEAFKRDQPEAEVHFVDAGHFALETQGEEIAGKIIDFFRRRSI